MSDIFKSKFGDDSTDSLGFLFIRAYNSWHYSIQSCLKKYNINHSQFVVMASLGYLLKTNSSITQITLAKQTNIDVMTLSKLLKKLVLLGYVQKETHKIDTRAKELFLTHDGVKIVNDTLLEVEKIDNSFFGKLSNENKKQLFQTLMILGNDI